MSLRFTGERRKSTRSEAAGGVRVTVTDPVRIAVQAELIETSQLGFRIAHGSKDLVPGVVVEYSISRTSGQARVIWTHVLEGRHVSGFMILHKSPEAA
jgi:hypothetical protein